MFSDLFDDEVFIGFTNAIGDLLEFIGTFVKGIGGLGGVLSGLGMILTRVFGQQMAEGFRNLAYNIKSSINLTEVQK
jgi:hypothetical protein